MTEVAQNPGWITEHAQNANSMLGDVVAAHVLSGPSLLRDAAVAAARRWKFKPATRDGKPISSVSTITFNFKI